MESASNTEPVGGLIRGVVVGVGFEAVTVLAIYAAWHLWRLIR